MTTVRDADNAVLGHTKLTRFADIPAFVQHGSYEVDFEPHRLIVVLDEWVAEQGLDLNPDFQRGHVWTPKQQTAFVEFLLKGGKTGRVIYLNNPTWHSDKGGAYKDFVIVDGLQRVQAIRQFFDNKIRAFGSFFREYTDKFRGVKNTMRVNVNDLQTRAEVLRWHLEFNTGGVVHSKQELARVKKLLDQELGGA